jgi:hypothetical protein
MPAPQRPSGTLRCDATDGVPYGIFATNSQR